MKTTISLALAIITCGICSAQSGSYGSVSSNWGFTITFESKLEPAKPDLAIPGESGIRHLDEINPGMKRFLTNTKTHEYFGYDMKAEPIREHAGTYRVTFSDLTLAPQDLKLPDPGSWRRLPAPLFPPPQIVSTADTIALDLFENPSTGQKIVDYIRLKRDNCDEESAGPGQIACLTSLVDDAQRSLADRLSHLESTRDRATVTSIKESQQTWEKYRDDACMNLPNEVKRLQCQLKLTRSHTHDLSSIY
jgi:uncharacterized protein YecT (DUF1311 family)